MAYLREKALVWLTQNEENGVGGEMSEVRELKKKAHFETYWQYKGVWSLLPPPDVF